jgi:hypothetical protein
MACLGLRALGGGGCLSFLSLLAMGCGGGAGTTSPDGGQPSGHDGQTASTDGSDARPPDGGAAMDAGGSGILALPSCAIANNGTMGYTPLWSVNDLNGQPFGDAICKN